MVHWILKYILNLQYSAFPTIIIKSLSVFCVVFMQLWLKIKRCHLNEDEYCAAVRCHIISVCEAFVVEIKFS